MHERGVARRTLLDLFSAYHGCPAVEFDERLSVPPELLEGADAGQLARLGRFPLLGSDAGIVIATVAPENLREESAGVQGSAQTEPWVAFELPQGEVYPPLSKRSGFASPFASVDGPFRP